MSAKQSAVTFVAFPRSLQDNLTQHRDRFIADAVITAARMMYGRMDVWMAQRCFQEDCIPIQSSLILFPHP
jgi:hypothetical protein